MAAMDRRVQDLRKKHTLLPGMSTTLLPGMSTTLLPGMSTTLLPGMSNTLLPGMFPAVALKVDLFY